MSAKCTNQRHKSAASEASCAIVALICVLCAMNRVIWGDIVPKIVVQLKNGESFVMIGQQFAAKNTVFQSSKEIIREMSGQKSDLPAKMQHFQSSKAIIREI